MRNILVPINFGSNSEVAVDFAVKIADKSDARIELIYVQSTPIYDTGIMDGEMEEFQWLNDLLLKESERKMQEVLDMYNSNVRISGNVLLGSRLSELVDYQKKDFDLLILGVETSSKSGGRLFGNFTDRLVHKSSVPVLVIKKPTRYLEIRNVVMGSSFDPDDRELPNQMAFIKSIFEAQIDLVRVNTPNDFESTEMIDKRIFELRKHIEPCSFHTVDHFTNEEGLLYYSTKVEADLIVIGDKNSSTIGRWILGDDLAEEMMDSSDLPMLVF